MRAMTKRRTLLLLDMQVTYWHLSNADTFFSPDLVVLLMLVIFVMMLIMVVMVLLLVLLVVGGVVVVGDGGKTKGGNHAKTKRFTCCTI